MYTPRLYHHSAIETFPAVPAANKKLGSPEADAIRNPLVNRALHELRRLVNCLLAQGKIDRSTQIIVEMANEVNNNNMREAIGRFQKQRKEERDGAVKAIREELHKLGQTRDPREDEILRYILWCEQDQKCLYTGKQIGFAQILDGNTTDIEHTHPASRARNNARENKTLCFAEFNRQIKKDLCPKELYESGVLIQAEMELRLKPWADKIKSLEKQIDNAKKASKVAETKGKKDKQVINANRLRMEKTYWKTKYDSFFKDISDGFIHRNLVDTRIINKYAKEYLKSYFEHVYTARGAQVSGFRKTVLNLEMRESEVLLEGREVAEKDRSEHSHHMVDALALCFLAPFLLQKQGKHLELEDYYRAFERMKYCGEPERIRIEQALPQHRRKMLNWQGAEEVPQLVDRLRKEFLVSHEQRVNTELWFLKKGKVRGQMHEDSIYGKIMRP
ncbi:MAG: type II CRISPR RNA-guided endonuclease Cas9, partial [Spirochaetota bacterium]